MRKLIVLEHLTLDGVIQSGGGPDEDNSNGFSHGGWVAPFQDETVGAITKEILDTETFDLLLGRKTFDIWEDFWPKHGDFWPGVNTATKYVASNSRNSSEWQPSVFLDGDVAQKVSDLKAQSGPDLHVWGSGKLVQTLMQHDLVDTFWLLIYPVTIGSGKRLFDDGTVPATFKVSNTVVAPNGVIHVTYDRAGDLKVGEVGLDD